MTMKEFVLGLLIILCVSNAAHSSETQSIGLKGVGNARELGGYSAEGGRTVKHGVFLRTAKLSAATSDDIKRLHDVYHLSVILDFRITAEREAAPDQEIPGAKNIHLRIINEQRTVESIYAEKYGKKPDISSKLDFLKIAIELGFVSEKMYIRFLSDNQGKEGYSRMFQEILAIPEGKSILFHCTQGKDRTGIAAMLILSALGFDEKTIIHDYLLTNTFNAELIASERRMLTENGLSGEELDAYMKAMDEVDPQYMINALEWMKENYSSVTGYIIKELGVTERQLEIMRSRFLENTKP